MGLQKDMFVSYYDRPIVFFKSFRSLRLQCNNIFSLNKLYLESNTTYGWQIFCFLKYTFTALQNDV